MSLLKIMQDEREALSGLKDMLVEQYQYIMKKRLTVARNMLTLGTPVTTACIECGFNDYSNFLKAFKREFGCNPSNFIKSNR